MPENRVLYLTYDGLTDPLGQSQILPYLSGLSSKGYSITVISAEKKENFAKRRAVIERIVEEASISWQPFFYTKKPPVLSTLWDLRKMYRLASRLHHRQPFRVVHCRSYLTSLIGLRLKQKYNVKFIFDMRGFWADERVEGEIWNLEHPIYKRIYQYFKKQERNFLQRADYTISLTHEAKQIIQEWPHLAAIPIQVIPCCVDTKLFQMQSFPESVKEHNTLADTVAHASAGLSSSGLQPEVLLPAQEHFPESLTISYLGSIGTWYLLDEMLLFYRRLLFHKPQTRFLFITPDNPQVIRERAALLEIPDANIEICAAERKEVPVLLAKSQFSLFFIKPCFSKKASSPTKMGEILAMGIPVICNAGVGDTDYLVEKYRAGVVVNAFEEADFDRAISQMDNVSLLPPEHFRKAALSYFDLQKGVDLYEEVYRRVLN